MNEKLKVYLNYKPNEKNQKNQLKHVPTVSEIENLDDPSRIPEGEARLIRDPETNEVIKVIYGTMKVDDNDESEEEIENPSVIKQLEEYAEKIVKLKRKDINQKEKMIGSKACMKNMAMITIK